MHLHQSQPLLADMSPPRTLPDRATQTQINHNWDARLPIDGQICCVQWPYHSTRTHPTVEVVMLRTLLNITGDGASSLSTSFDPTLCHQGRAQLDQESAGPAVLRGMWAVEIGVLRMQLNAYRKENSGGE